MILQWSSFLWLCLGRRHVWRCRLGKGGCKLYLTCVRWVDQVWWHLAWGKHWQRHMRWHYWSREGLRAGKMFIDVSRHVSSAHAHCSSTIWGLWMLILKFVIYHILTVNTYDAPKFHLADTWRADLLDLSDFKLLSQLVVKL